MVGSSFKLRGVAIYSFVELEVGVLFGRYQVCGGGGVVTSAG